MLTLEQAIQEALGNNLQLAAERYSISVAEAREITARLRPNPVLTVSGQTLNLLGASYNNNSPLGPNQYNAHTDFPIERGGKRKARMELAAVEKTVAELGVREVMRQVIFNVQSAYVDVQQAQANLDLAEQNLASLQGVVDVNRSRVDVGDLAEVELQRSEIASLQYQNEVDQAQLQLDQAKTQLRLLLGRQQQSLSFDVSGQFRSDSLLDAQPQLVELALERRPDYLASERGQTRTQADLRLQLANGKVDYSFGTEYTYQHAYGIGGSSLGFSFSAPLPIFNKNEGEIARAERELQQGIARLRAASAAIDAEVESAYREYEVSLALLENVESNMLAKARSVRDITEYSYRLGEATLVEFLDAQRAFNDTMQTYNSARAAYARSLYRIDSVSGASLTTTP